MRKLRIKQVRSTNGKSETQRLTIKGLGLGKINREVISGRHSGDQRNGYQSAAYGQR